MHSTPEAWAMLDRQIPSTPPAARIGNPFAKHVHHRLCLVEKAIFDVPPGENPCTELILRHLSPHVLHANACQCPGNCDRRRSTRRDEGDPCWDASGLAGAFRSSSRRAPFSTTSTGEPDGASLNCLDMFELGYHVMKATSAAPVEPSPAPQQAPQGPQFGRARALFNSVSFEAAGLLTPE